MTKKYDSILLDIDNTLTDLQFTLDVMSEVFEHPAVTPDDIHSFTLSKAYGVSDEQEKNFWVENEYKLSKGSILEVERVKHILATYTHEDTTIFVVTMRPQEMFEVTFNWLRANNINFDHLICLGKESKVDYAMHFGIEALFEDNPTFFEEVFDRNLEDEFDLFVVDYPYNRHIEQATRLDRKSGRVMQVELV